MLVTGFPFGLYQISKPVNVLGNTIVWPKCDDVETLHETVGTQFAIDASSSRQSGNEGETIGVRNYRYGDSVRNIHWSHTARHNRLVIRERQASTQTPIRVVLDLRQSQHSGTGSQSTYETAIGMAASVCNELHRKQSQIEIVCVGLNEKLRSRSNNHRGIKPLMDFLSLLPQLSDRSAFAEEAILAPLGNGHVFTFLIHTDQFVPETNSSTLRYLCVDSNFDEGLELDLEEFPSKSEQSVGELIVDPGLMGNEMGVSHVAT